jgi:hypothetical protein
MPGTARHARKMKPFASPHIGFFYFVQKGENSRKGNASSGSQAKAPKTGRAGSRLNGKPVIRRNKTP